MLVFCPCCGNMLTIGPAMAEQLPSEDKHLAGKNRFYCRTCPYQNFLNGSYFERKRFTPKEDDDILGGADSWKNVDKTRANCVKPKCDNEEAYFRQVQIRSADEPMTMFYKCTKCSAEWREN